MNKKPKIELYWTPYYGGGCETNYAVSWRLVGANGEIMCQSTQGFRDKTDAMRSVESVHDIFSYEDFDMAIKLGRYRIVGPGRKPK